MRHFGSFHMRLGGKMGDEWHEWLGSLNHGDDCKHFEDVMGQTECERSSGEYSSVEPDDFCSRAEPREEQ